VLASLGHVDQMMVTGTDLDRFPEEFADAASVIAVKEGSTRPAASPGAKRSR